MRAQPAHHQLGRLRLEVAAPCGSPCGSVVDGRVQVLDPAAMAADQVTLAPIFAAAYLAGSREALLVGLAAAAASRAH